MRLLYLYIRIPSSRTTAELTLWMSFSHYSSGRLLSFLQFCEHFFVMHACNILQKLMVHSLVTSPITSYADQIYAIRRNRSSAGFSLDIPLIMLIASIVKSV